MAERASSLLEFSEQERSDSDMPVTCQVLGDAVLAGIENGVPDDLTPYSSSTRSTRNGRAIAYVRMGKSGGMAQLHVFAKDMHATFDLR